MYKTNTSVKKLFKSELFGWLLVIVLGAGFPADSKGQEQPDFKKPFKKCWDYGGKNGLSYIIASDNESQIVISNSNSSLVSIDPATKLENWKSEIRGQIQPAITFDENNLFFITNFESNSEPDNKENTESTSTLNSISLKTGITKWQEKTPEKTADNTNIEIRPIYHKELIFITGEKMLSAVQKENGVLRWRKNFPKTIVSVNSTSPTEIRILTEDHLFRIAANTGDILEDTAFESNSSKNFVLNENHLLLGNSTGEIIKIIPGRGKNNTLWKIKTGGSISALIELDDKVLVSSLDNFLYLFSVDSGKLKWKRRVSGRITQSPLIFNNYAIVINSADSYASVIDLSDGKVINQIKIEEENYFSGPPSVFKNQLLLQTFKGIYFFSNSDINC